MPFAPIADALAARIHAFVTEGIDLAVGRITTTSKPFWQGLRDLGTELWLDTGDLDAAGGLWCSAFSALTTNNTLLNAEVQKGIYDELVRKSGALLKDVPAAIKVIEIAFILNARHGLRLAQRFGGKVSVELHTDLSYDVDAAVSYGVRYYAICPKHFIVKVPFTAAGILATRELRKRGVPVNFTLGFGARQNYVATALAAPSYVNVFLGRLGAYIKDNGLGDGNLVGERATIASQAAVVEWSKQQAEPTKQIAASLRSASQLADLAGVDVYTIPVAVAKAGPTELKGDWTSRREAAYQPKFSPAAAGARVEKLWEIGAAEKALAESLRKQIPKTAQELIDRAHQLGAGDLFPKLSAADLAQIAADGKIPKHERWKERIAKGELAIDTLLNLAGLASFTADQKALDDRIRKNLG